MVSTSTVTLSVILHLNLIPLAEFCSIQRLDVHTLFITAVLVSITIFWHQWLFNIWCSPTIECVLTVAMEASLTLGSFCVWQSRPPWMNSGPAEGRNYHSMPSGHGGAPHNFPPPMPSMGGPPIPPNPNGMPPPWLQPPPPPMSQAPAPHGHPMGKRQQVLIGTSVCVKPGMNSNSPLTLSFNPWSQKCPHLQSAALSWFSEHQV